MSKVIVSGGCSFAYGFNLKNRDDRYASLLANHYGVDLIDVSGPGKSNETIATSVSYGLTQARKKYDPSNIVVIVGWTETARMEYWDKERAMLQSCFFTGYIPHTILAEKQRLGLISDFITNKLWDPCYSYHKLLHAFNYVHALCVASGVRVIHLKNLNIIKATMPNHGKNRLDSLRLTNYTEDSIFPESKSMFDAMCEATSFRDLIIKDQKYLLSPGIDHHPNELGHQMWAKQIKQLYDYIIKCQK